METKNIKITELGVKEFTNNEGKKFTQVKLKDQDDVKYMFYDTKKSDGSKTKAYLAFEAGKIQLNKEYLVGFNAVPSSFVNNQGKTIKFDKRYVAFFDDPASETPPNPFQGSDKPEEAEIKEVNIEDIPF
tara:strand:- start:4418 stop:4807 length:390 start_codon:yes stop_codon:yes gene_type:complete